MAQKDVSVRLTANVDNYRKGMQDASKSTTDLDKTTATTTSSVGSKWGSAGSMIASNMGLSMAAAGTAALAVGKYAVDAASNLTESMNAVDVSYGKSSEAVHKLGADSVEAFGLSERAFNEAAVGFTSFATDVAGEGGNVVGTLDDLMTRSTDFASVMNMDVTEAANAFKSALSGEAEPLKQFGINISDAAVKAHALEKGLAGAGREMTDQEKVQARYSLLMQETAKTQGDWAATSDGFAGSMKKMKAETENLAASLGVVLLPALTYVVGAIADLAAAAQDFGDRLNDIPGFRNFVLTIKDIPSTLDDFENAIWGAAGNLTGINAEAEETTGTFLGFADGVTAAGDVTNTYSGQVHMAGDAINEWREDHERIIGPLQSETEEIYGQISAIKGLIESTTASAVALIEETQAVEAIIDARRRSTENIYAAEDAEDAWWQQIQETTAALEDATLGEREKAASLRDLAVATDEQVSAEMEAQGVTRDTVAGQQAWVDKMLAVAAGLSGPTRDAVLNHIALVSGIPADKLTSIHAEVDSASLRSVEAALNFAARMRDVRFNPVTGGVPRYAVGTSNHPGGMAWVGEQGPELVSLPQGAKVYPAGTSAAMASSSTSTSTGVHIDSATFTSGVALDDVFRVANVHLAMAGAS